MMQTFVIQFDTSQGVNRSVEIEAPSVDAAISKWDLMRQPGDFIQSIGKPFRIQWPND